MSELEHYQNLIQEKVKNISFRDFLLHVCSWIPCMFYKRWGMTSVYPDTDRIDNLLHASVFSRSEPKEYIYEKQKSFFENLSVFRTSSRLPTIRQFPPTENSEYAEASGWGVKNCYLDFWAYMDCENILYSFEVKEKCANIYNSVMVWDHSENVYQSNGVLNGYNIFYSRFIHGSNNVWFSSNLIGCSECILCDNLTNAAYSIQNISYKKEEYFEKKKDLLKRKLLYSKLYHQVSKEGINMLSENVTWNFSIKWERLESSFYTYNIHNGKNIAISGSAMGNHNMYNVGVSWSPHGNDYYNVLNSGWGDHLYCSDMVTGSFLYYSYHCFDSHHCLGCIGLKNKSYCILNKEYSKEEWEILAEKVFASMEADGTLGNFFPASLNPFYFNDTAAFLMDDSFTKEEVESEGYLWRDEPIRVDIPEWLEVVKSNELDRFQGFRKGSFMKGAVEEVRGDWGFSVSNNSEEEILRPSDTSFQKEANWYIDPAILEKVIVDEKWNYYRIIKMEYDFLMKYGLPLPTMHWLDRIKSWFCFDSK